MNKASIKEISSWLSPTTLLWVTALVLCAVIFYPFVIDVSLAAIFALGLHPLLVKFRILLQRKFPKLPTWIKRSVGALTLGFGFLITFILVMAALSQTYESIKDLATDDELKNRLVQNLESSWHGIQGTLKGVTDLVGFGDEIVSKGGEYIGNIGRFLIGGVVAVLSQIPTFAMHFMVVIVFLLLFLAKAQVIYSFLSRAKGFSTDGIDDLLQTLQMTSLAVVSSNFLIGTVQATIVTFGAAISGYSHWAIIFVGTFICSFIPLIGAGPFALLLALISYSSNDSKGAIVLLVTAAIGGSIDNIIRPMLVARAQKNLNVFVSFIGIIGAVIVLGFPGLFIGPFAMALVVNLYPKLK